MRTNIDIDDKLMDYVMATGEFKTKREAVEEGLKLIKRRRAYDALLAARGTLFWDDSDEAWARSRAEAQAEAQDPAQRQAEALARIQPTVVAPQVEDSDELSVCEPAAAYTVMSSSDTTSPAAVAPGRSRRKAAAKVKA